MTVNMTIAKIMYVYYSRSSRSQSKIKARLEQHNEYIFLRTLYVILTLEYVLHFSYWTCYTQSRLMNNPQTQQPSDRTRMS